MAAQDDDGFISRWARRKSDSAAPGGLKKKTPEVVEPVRGRMITDPVRAAEPEVESEELALATSEDQQVLDESSCADAEPEAELDLEHLESIDIEALDFNADFTKFMQPGVPERLRQRALSRLWGTNPILANVDGLNDYDDDFTDAALAVDVLKTSWKVGQGYLTDAEVEARDAERLGDPADDDATANEEDELVASDEREPTGDGDPEGGEAPVDELADLDAATAEPDVAETDAAIAEPEPTSTS